MKAKVSRSYARLTKADRLSIQRGLDRNQSCRTMAADLGRSASTIHDEVMRHRFITSPKARKGEMAPVDIGLVCARLGSWPHCCNGCKKHAGYGCSLKPKVFYDAGLAQKTADADLSEARRGIDETEEVALKKIALIKDSLARGLSPEQMCAIYPELGLSKTTIYAWIDKGFGDMTNLDLRRKVGYKPRHHAAGRSKPTRHSQKRRYDAFEALDQDIRASAWEMDTVEGTNEDTQCLLTLYHRPTSFQLAILLSSQSCQEVQKALRMIRDILGGPQAMSRVFGVVLTDNGSEFADESAIAALFGEQTDEVHLFFCDSHRPDQKGGCERNHSELRKILPKGKGISFDHLSPQDCSVVMSHINSEPRGKLAWLTPYQLFKAAFKDDAQAILDAFNIQSLDPDDLDLTQECINHARAKRGDQPLM